MPPAASTSLFCQQPRRATPLPRCLCCSSLATTAGVCYELSRFPLCQASWSSQMFYEEISYFFVTWAAEINPLLTNTALSKNPNISNCHETTTVVLSPSAHTHPSPLRIKHTDYFCVQWETRPSSQRLGRSLRVWWVVAVATPLLRLMSVSATAVGTCREPSYVWYVPDFCVSLASYFP